jgi:hypothetical protein
VLVWLGLLCLAIVGLAAAAVRAHYHKKELSELAGRESLNDEAVFSTFYQKHGLAKESVLEVWNEIAATLKLPPDKLRPTDRFGSNIGTHFITSEDLDSLFELGERRASRLNMSVNFGELTTVDDYVRALAKKTGPAPTKNTS